MSARTPLATIGSVFLIVLLGVGATGPLAAQDNGKPPVPEFVGSHRDWNVYKFTDDSQTICYIASEPKKQEGNYTRRGSPAVLVTRRPGAHVVYEVSVDPGYTYLDGSNVEIKVDNQKKFLLFTRGEHAWTPKEEDDKDLISAMKRGSDMTVRGTSSKDTYSLDTYSLLGFTAAYDAMSDACSGSSASGKTS
jgi:Invasion associated locus B (IalB) protein